MLTKAKYPDCWKAFSRDLRENRAKFRCECMGICGLHRTTGGPRRCTERHMQPARWARGRVVLTTAHVCTCDPLCAIATHVLVMCNRCHLRIDVDLHRRNAAENRMRRKEQAGQVNFLEG